jgi:hypothetical protein
MGSVCDGDDNLSCLSAVFARVAIEQTSAVLVACDFVELRHSFGAGV